MTSIMDYWVFKNKDPYASQIKALEWLENTQDKKYHILESPVGTGKSAIGLTWSRYLSRGAGNSFILTPQKILQTQYFDTMPDIGIMKGKNNYMCGNMGVTCDIAEIMGCTAKENCTYNTTKKRELKMPNIVLNYHLASLLFKYTDISSRTLLIADECHNLESFLTEMDAVEVKQKHLSSIHCHILPPNTTNLVQLTDWMRSVYLPAAYLHYTTLEEAIEENKNSNMPKNHLYKIIREYDALGEQIERTSNLLDIPELDLIHDYIIVTSEKDIKVKCIYGKQGFQQILDPMGSNILLMSGTIFDKQQYCSDIGIDPEQTEFLSMDSEFDKEHRPVIFMPSMQMNRGWNEPEKQKHRDNVIDNICMILKENHSNDSGIIHTTSFAISKWLIEELDKRDIPHKIYHHADIEIDSDMDAENSVDTSVMTKRDSIIDKFINSKQPALLISPSITEGLDLKDDLSRFGIFVKVPYPSLGDQWVKKRMDISSKWYQLQTLKGIMQGCGRVVRNKTDYGVIYILDTSWSRLYGTTHQYIPQWWKDAYHQL